MSNPSVDQGKNIHDPLKGKVKKVLESIGVCERCGRKQHVLPIAFQRRCRPRCTACGGLLEPAPALHKRLFGKLADA